ncbi:MAG: hypothetical protein IPJ88_04285 [Myxococcales bacterium]|nr:MAG: hypothetical protein IPJ88_04285 [Myxococcales bacterium]
MHRLVSILLFTFLVISTNSCKKSQDIQSFPIEVFVETPDQVKLESVSLLVNDKLIGTTNARGQIAFELHGKVGDTNTLAIVCPKGFRSENDTARFRLREFSPIGDKQEIRSLRHSFVCAPEKVKVAVLVSASGKENLPILIEGRTIARTNKNGVAHLVVESKPDERLTLLIDTQSDSLLQPQNPTKTLEVSATDAIYTFEQSFERKVRKRRKIKHSRPKLIPMPIR